jgi:hypothetical protein
MTDSSPVSGAADVPDTDPADDPVTGPFADPEYRAAVIDLLALIAYGELSAFERLAEDAKLAPTLLDRAELAGMAANEFGHYRRLADRLVELEVDPIESMLPFVRAFEDFHARTAPSDWLEGLVKAYVGDGLAADFNREIAAFLDNESRTLIIESMADGGQADFAVDRVVRAIAADPRIGGRLALWARRLMGEALSQAQRVAAERDTLAALLAGGVEVPGLDLAAIGRLFTRLTENHIRRMERMGLAS